MFNRFFNTAADSYFLFGPRGTGKSTYLLSQFKHSVLINLLDPEVLRNYRTQPNRFRDLVYTHKANKTFIIDEVQKAPQLLSIVHQLIEENKHWQFILTGSSSRKLKQSGVDLLGGRAHIKHLHPFMAAELGNTFKLEQAIHYGMLPLIINSSHPEQQLKAYIALYVQEEVMIEGLIRKIDQFHYFLEAISFSQTSQLNYTNIATDCGVSSKTVESYISILEDLLIAHRVYHFNKRAKRQLSQHPKFYFFDAGVFQTLRPKGPLEDTSSLHGQIIETLVFQHLKAWLDYSDPDGKLYFWRTRSGLEVDFIIYGECGFYAFEVKASKNIKPRDFRGLHEFAKDYPEAKLFLIHMDSEYLIKNDIHCYPLEKFLMELKPNDMLPS